MNNYSRHWFFTWEINAAQKKLPNELKLRAFLNRIADRAQFQKERGEKKGRLHYQGYFEISGPRTSKNEVLSMFRQEFYNCKGLSIRKVFSVEASIAYTSKQATRESPTVYCGRNEVYDEKHVALCNKPWQTDLHVFLKMLKNNIPVGEKETTQQLRYRALIWVEDVLGGAGKSDFIKWLVGGQKELRCCLLPIDSPDRIAHAVCLITKSMDMDVFLIDDTKTKGEATSFNNMFESIERVKNGHMVSTMYGKYSQSLYDRPLIIFCTNRKIQDYLDYLSDDRWYHMKIVEGRYLEKRGFVDTDIWKKTFGTLPSKGSSNVLPSSNFKTFEGIIDTSFSEDKNDRSNV